VTCRRAPPPRSPHALAIRWKWENSRLGPPGRRARLQGATLRDRLPACLRDALSGPAARRFTSLYLLVDEWVGEIADRTVHGVLQLGWAPDQAGDHRGQMAINVKPNGCSCAGSCA